MKGFAKWPTLQQCLQQGSLEFIDLKFAESILKKLGSDKEEHATLLAVLFVLLRQGHLALDTTRDQLEITLDRLQLMACLELLLKGIDSFPASGITDGQDGNTSTWIHRLDTLYYLQKNWMYESQVRQHLMRLHQSIPALSLEPTYLNAQLNSAQAEAVAKGMQHALSFLTGGPGTGKTFTASAFVQACLLALPEEKRKDFRIILTAPTGKAVAQLEGNLRKTFSDGSQVQSGTLHAVLNLKMQGFEEEETAPLFADLIIVDECSMIDVKIFAKLLAAVLKGTRLLLIGDKDQLPPVEAGSIFADLLDLKLFPATQLTTSLRSDRRALLDLARHIKEGDVASSLQLLTAKTASDIQWKTFDQFTRETLGEYCQKKFPSFQLEKPEPADLLPSLNRFILLSCMRQGMFGVDEINRHFLYQSLSSVPLHAWWIVPVMITRNDYALDLYNGDLGLLVRKVEEDFSLRQFSTEDYALFSGRDANFRQVPALALTAFEYSYCLSVHKSQGSEYDEVLILMPQGSELFGREVLYTAVTRSRKQAILVADQEILSRTIANSSRKISGLRVVDRL